MQFYLSGYNTLHEFAFFFYNFVVKVTINQSSWWHEKDFGFQMDCLGKFSSEVSELPCSHLCAGRTSYNKDIKLMMKETAFLYFQDKSSTYKSTNG